MLLEDKIQQIVTNSPQIYYKVYSRLQTKLNIDGSATVTYITFIKCLIELLQISGITYNIKLELYKKLTHMLRMFDIYHQALSDNIMDEDLTTIYWGVGAPGLNANQLQSTLISRREPTQSELALLFSPNVQVYYFCAPASLGTLISIKDNNGFETINGWTLRTLNFVVLGQTILYNIYEFNNLTTQTEFTNTFKY